MTMGNVQVYKREGKELPAGVAVGMCMHIHACIIQSTHSHTHTHTHTHTHKDAPGKKTRDHDQVPAILPFGAHQNIPC